MVEETETPEVSEAPEVSEQPVEQPVEDHGQPEPASPPAPQAAPQEPQPKTFDAKPWSEVADKFTAAFPNLEPKEMENKYNAVRRLAMERQRIADEPSYTSLKDAAIAAMPFAGYGAKVLQETEYQNAKERIFDGNPRDEYHPLVGEHGQSDFEKVARWERENADRSQRSMAGNLAVGGVGAGRFVGETVLGGAAGKAIGLGAKAAGWFGLGAATTGSSLEGAAERASGKQDESRFYSPENVIPEATIGAATALVMGGANRWAQGIASPIVRYLAEVGGGVAGIQGVKVAAGAMDEFLAPAWKTNTGYGVMGKIVRGEGGPALQEAVTDTLTMAALSLLHAGGKSEVHDQVIVDIKDSLNESAKQGLPPNEAAARVRSKVNQSAADTLGVKPDATPEEIKAAWRKRTKETHPDVGGDREEYDRVQWAYNQMTGEATRHSARQRQQYQEQPKRPQAPPESPGSQQTPDPVYEPHPSMAPEAQEPAQTAAPGELAAPRERGQSPAVPERPGVITASGEGQRQIAGPVNPGGPGEPPETNQVDQKRQAVNTNGLSPQAQDYMARVRAKQAARAEQMKPKEQPAEVSRKMREFDKYETPTDHERFGLSKVESFAYDSIQSGKPVNDIVSENNVGLNSKQAVHQAALRASTKLGNLDENGQPKSATRMMAERSLEKGAYNPDGSKRPVMLTDEATANYQEELAKQGTYLSDVEAKEDLRKSAVDVHAQEDARQKLWQEYFEEAKKTPEYKKGTDDDRARLWEDAGKRYEAGEDPPPNGGKKYAAKQRKLAKRAKAERDAENEATVRPSYTGGLREDTAERAGTENQAPVGSAEGSASSSTGSYSEAAGNVVSREDQLAKETHEETQKAFRAGFSASKIENAVRQGVEHGEGEADAAAGLSKSEADALIASRPEPITAPANPGAVQAGDGSAQQRPAGANPGSGDQPGGTGGRSLADHVKDVATQFIHDDGAAVNLDTLKEKMAQVASAAHYTAQAVRRLAGQMFPDTTKLDRVSGEKMAEWAAAEVHAVEQGEWYGNEVVGFPEGSKEDIRLGAVLTEMALGYTRAAYGREATRLSNLAGAARQQAAQATNPSDKARFLHQAAEFSSQASDAMNARLKVTSVIGMHGSPFTTLQEFQQAKANPVVQKQLKDWRDKLSYVLDDNYRESKGISAFAPIDAPTQMPGLTVNLMGLQEGDKVSSTMGSQGNPKNLRLKKNPFSNQRTGAAEAYELSAHKMIQNSFAKGTPNAARAVFVRTAVANKIAELAPRGTKIEGMTEFIDAKPPAGTQDAGPRDTSFFIKDAAAGEYRTIVDIDKHNDFTKIMSVISQIPTVGALSSAVEIMTHGANLATALQAPGMLFTLSGAVGLARNEWRQFFRNHEFQREVMELSEIGATKGRGAESGTIVGAARKIGVALFDKEIPKSVDKYDPTYWTGRSLHHFDKLMRVSLGQAYDRMAAAEPHLKTDTGKRDFINQWVGMYNRKAQNCVVRWLRASGFGPFATAATGQTVGSIRNLAGSPRMGSPGWSQSRLRLSFLARIVGTLVGGVFAYNFARWGRIDGDADTPFGHIKLDDAPNGKKRSWDMMRFTGVTRGLRAIGGLAVIEGLRRGQSAGTIADHAISDIGHTLAHPFTGPLTQFGYTAWTGKDTMGRQIAEKVSTATTPKGMAKAAQTGKPAPGSSQMALNVQAALENMNQPYATLFGRDRSRKNDTTAEETASKLFQPLGIKYRDISKKKR